MQEDDALQKQIPVANHLVDQIRVVCSLGYPFRYTVDAAAGHLPAIPANFCFHQLGPLVD